MLVATALKALLILTLVGLTPLLGEWVGMTLTVTSPILHFEDAARVDYWRQVALHYLQSL